MATKLTTAFAEFVGGRGFLIANEGEICQQPGGESQAAFGRWVRPVGRSFGNECPTLCASLVWRGVT